MKNKAKPSFVSAFQVFYLAHNFFYYRLETQTMLFDSPFIK